MNTPLYLGVDPDLRTLNMAVLIGSPEGPTPLAIFLRRNAGGRGDTAVAGAVKGISGILDDFVRFMAANEDLQSREIVLIVESQNMQQTAAYRRKGTKVDYQDILHTGQLSGIWMGVFAEVATRIVLVQPAAWKGQVPKDIHHKRIYSRLNFNMATFIVPPGAEAIPRGEPCLTEYSAIQPNPGDFLDINDSLGLALWGYENNK